jgi:hypothetical protein
MKWRKARKKPVVVEFREAEPKEKFSMIRSEPKMGEIIKTREGDLRALCEEDFIIRGVDGELYPIKKEIFYKTYEVVEA